MMKFRKIETDSSGPGLTPLLQIVFLLLTFFMVAINLENTKADERSKLPKDMLAKPPSIRQEHELVLNLRYVRDETGRRRSAVSIVFYNQRSVEIENLAPELEREKQVLEQMHGRDVIDRVTVVIRAESSIPMGLVQQLVKKCQDHGFSRFSMREVPEVTMTGLRMTERRFWKNDN